MKKIMSAAALKGMPGDYVEPFGMTYDEFPQAVERPRGMQTLNVDLQQRHPQVKLNVVYAYKDETALHLHIIVPAGAKRFPLIMWVQGSAFHKQHLGNHLPQMVEVAEHGYVVAMVEYRYAPKWAFPVQVRDLNTATRFMLAHAEQYHVDPRQYIAWGDSSGGHTVTLATVTAGQQFFSDEDVDTMPLHFKACVDFYGPTDISRMNKVPSTQDHVTAHSLEGEFLGIKDIYQNPELVQRANPINYISKDRALPPFLIMHGNKDRLVPFEQSCLLYKALRKSGHHAAFYRLANSDHGSDGFFTPEALNVVFDFLKQ